MGKKKGARTKKKKGSVASRATPSPLKEVVATSDEGGAEVDEQQSVAPPRVTTLSDEVLLSAPHISSSFDFGGSTSSSATETPEPLFCLTSSLTLTRDGQVYDYESDPEDGTLLSPHGDRQPFTPTGDIRANVGPDSSLDSFYVDTADGDEAAAVATPATPTSVRSTATPVRQSAVLEGTAWTQDLLAVLDDTQQVTALSDDSLMTELENGEPVSAPLRAAPELIDRYRRYARLANNFLSMACTYAKVIISEACVPVAQKTIKPSASMGGVAGGEKFVAGGILFKFAVDWRGLFGGSDEFAMKAASHELRGLMAVNECRVEGLYTPLVCLIDYLGFRLIAISTLPIGSDTLVYGSADGGRTVYDGRGTAFASLMEEVGTKLNLTKHCAGLSPGDASDGSTDTHIVGPTDIEGHLGRDGRFYMVDLARLFPPEPPPSTGRPTPATSSGSSTPTSSWRSSASGVPVASGSATDAATAAASGTLRGAHLALLLRPELVRSNPEPLSSDALTRFGHGHRDTSTNNAAVRAAHSRLIDLLVPQTGIWLSSADGPLSDGASAAELRLVAELHRRGINARYMGAVRQWCFSDRGLGERARSVLLTEMIARAAKNYLRHRMRSRLRAERIAMEESFRDEVVNFLNVICGVVEKGKLTPLDAAAASRQAVERDNYFALLLYRDHEEGEAPSTAPQYSPALCAEENDSQGALSPYESLYCGYEDYAEVASAVMDVVPSTPKSTTSPGSTAAPTPPVAPVPGTPSLAGKSESELFWKVLVKRLLLAKYGRRCMTSEELDPSVSLRPFIDVPTLLTILCSSLGMSLAPRTVSELRKVRWERASDKMIGLRSTVTSIGVLRTPSGTIHAVTKMPNRLPSFEFFPADLATLPLRTKAMNVVEYAQGTVYLLQSTRRTGRAAERLFALALESYATAVRLRPADNAVLVAWGNALFRRAQSAPAGPARDDYFNKAVDKYTAARSTDMLFALASAQHALAVRLCEKARFGPERASSILAPHFQKVQRLFRAGLDVARDLNKTDDLHRGYFCWACAAFDRAILWQQRPVEAGQLYSKAIALAPERYPDEILRVTERTDDNADCLLANAVHVALRAAGLVSFKAWRDVHLTPVRRFNWTWCSGLTRREAAGLARLFPSLQDLELASCSDLTDAELMVILADVGGTLLHLDIRRCDKLTPDAMGQVAEYCPKLETLDARGCFGLSSNASLISLLVRRCPRLTSLHLECIHVGEGGFETLQGLAAGGGSRLAGRVLTSLSLARAASLTEDRLCTMLATRMYGSALTNLAISWSPAVTEQSLRVLQATPAAATLRRLSFVNCPGVTRAAILELLAHTPELREIDLRRTLPRLGDTKLLSKRAMPKDATALAVMASASADSLVGELRAASGQEDMRVLLEASWTSEEGGADATLRRMRLAGAVTARLSTVPTGNGLLPHQDDVESALRASTGRLALTMSGGARATFTLINPSAGGGSVRHGGCLSLSHTRITDVIAYAIVRSMISPAVASLSLAHVMADASVSEVFRKLCPLMPPTSVQDLSVSEVGGDSDGLVRAIGRAFALHAINVSNSSLTDEGLTDLLGQRSTLITLALPSNNLHLVGPSLSPHLHSLRVLNLSKNRLGGPGLRSLARALEHADVGAAPGGLVLTLDSIGQPDCGGLRALGRALCSRGTRGPKHRLGVHVVALSLERCALDGSMITALLDGVAERAKEASEANDEEEPAEEAGASVFSPLVRLNLSRNLLGNEGAAVLAKALSSHHLSCLEHVEVAQNALSDAGIGAFATALADLPAASHLRHLDLSRNAASAQAIASFSPFIGGRHAGMQPFVLELAAAKVSREPWTSAEVQLIVDTLLLTWSPQTPVTLHLGSEHAHFTGLAKLAYPRFVKEQSPRGRVASSPRGGRTMIIAVDGRTVTRGNSDDDRRVLPSPRDRLRHVTPPPEDSPPQPRRSGSFVLHQHLADESSPVARMLARKMASSQEEEDDK
jgi:hypothetical protein